MAEPTIKTIVITGASSGIGEALALHLAKRHYNLVIASRSQAALEAVAARCREAGAQAEVVVADVSKAEDIAHLTTTSIQRFGRVDVWINNASVIFYGRFLDMQPHEFRQVLETNLASVVYGSRAALAHFREQGRGTLINISSGLGAVPAPYASSYVTSKFAVRGLTESLYQELAADGVRDIHVCCVLPATINTPVYQHGGNRMPHAVRAMPPVYSIHTAVRTITKLLDRPKPEVVVGKAIRGAFILYALFPGLFLRLFARYVRRYGQSDTPATATTGNTFHPGKDGEQSGGWSNTSSKPHKEAL